MRHTRARSREVSLVHSFAPSSPPTPSPSRLSRDLYNKKTHFLLEFIQNADDNRYADNVIPSMNLRIEDNLVVFECNELGFSASNIRAICDIGGSTKARATSGFIGAFSSTLPYIV
jgi:hypothetical protein